MAYEFIVGDAIVNNATNSPANYDTGAGAFAIGSIDNITSGNWVDTANGGTYTDPDSTFLPSDSGGPTRVRVTFPTPTSGTGLLVGIQTFFTVARRVDGGGNPPGSAGFTPSLFLNNGTTQTAGGTEVTQTGTATLVGRFEWNATTLSISDGSGVECEVFQTSGGAGGRANRRGYIEVGEILWIAQTADPLIYDPFNYGEIIE